MSMVKYYLFYFFNIIVAREFSTRANSMLFFLGIIVHSLAA